MGLLHNSSSTLLFAAAACVLQPASCFNLQHHGSTTSAVAKLQKNAGLSSSPVLSGRQQTAGSSSALRVAAGGAVEGSSEEGKGTGTATIPDEVFNLVKSIVGAGVLSLPAGM